MHIVLQVFVEWIRKLNLNTYTSWLKWASIALNILEYIYIVNVKKGKRNFSEPLFGTSSFLFLHWMNELRALYGGKLMEADCLHLPCCGVLPFSINCCLLCISDSRDSPYFSIITQLLHIKTSTLGSEGNHYVTSLPENGLGPCGIPTGRVQGPFSAPLFP